MGGPTKWWAKNFLPAEHAAVVTVLCLAIAWAQWMGGATAISDLMKDNRSAIYGAVASVAGSLLGFLITSVSVVLGFSSSERLEILRQSRHYDTLSKTFIAGIRALGFATLAALTALVADKERSPHPLFLGLACYAAMLALARLLRCIWIFEIIVRIMTAPSKARVGSESRR